MYELLIVLVLIIIAILESIFRFVTEHTAEGGFERQYLTRYKYEVGKLISSGYYVEEKRERPKSKFSNSIIIATRSGEQIQITVLIPHNWPKESPKINDGFRTFEGIDNYTEDMLIIDIVNTYCDRIRNRISRINEEILLLKTGYTVNEVPITDIDQLQAYDYKLVVSNQQWRYVNVFIPMKWPKFPPILECSDDWISAYDYVQYNENTHIVDIIKAYFEHPEYSKKYYRVLVYCHPDTDLEIDDPDTHQIIPVMKEFLEHIGQKEKYVKIQTLDIDGEPDFHVKDGFSDKFIDKNTNKFDAVWLPDCDGPWWQYQVNGWKVNFIELINKVAKLVKPGGFLICWKITYFDVKDIVEELRKQKTYPVVEEHVFKNQVPKIGSPFETPPNFDHTKPLPFIVIRV